MSDQLPVWYQKHRPLGKYGLQLTIKQRQVSRFVEEIKKQYDREVKYDQMPVIRVAKINTEHLDKSIVKSL